MSSDGLANACSIIAALQNKSPALQTPTVARSFDTVITPSMPVENVDLFGQPFTSASPRPPFTPGVLHALCDLTILQNEITKYNDDMLQVNVQVDLVARRALYKKTLSWRKSLPDHLLNELNSTPGTCLLRVHYEEVAIFALRFLHPSIDHVDNISVKDLRIIHCQQIVATVEHHFRTHLPGEYCAMFLNALYHVCITLIPSLDDIVSQEIFTRAAMGLRREPLDLPGLVFPIRGIEAVARGMNKELPPVAKAAFQSVKMPADFGDMLIEYGFPQQLENVQVEVDESSDHRVDLYGKLGALLCRWNALTL